MRTYVDAAGLVWAVSEHPDRTVYTRLTPLPSRRRSSRPPELVRVVPKPTPTRDLYPVVTEADLTAGERTMLEALREAAPDPAEAFDRLTGLYPLASIPERSRVVRVWRASR